MENSEKRLDEIFEVVTFIKDNAVTKQEFSSLEKRVIKIEATMITKEYLDEKLADLRGDLVVLMRKEDTKLKTLVDILTKKQVITDNDAKQILTMEPFPQLI